MTKVDPGLLHVVARHLERPSPSAATMATATAPVPVHVTVRFTGDVGDLRATGFAPLGRIRTARDGSSIAAGRLPLDRLGALEAVDHVVEIEGSPPLQPLLNRSVPAIGADLLHAAPYGLTGEGVVIGIIDVGFDWRHPAFRRPDGSTRVLGIWDQTLTPRRFEGEDSPSQFPELGVEYGWREINRALENQGVVRTAERRDGVGFGHGTHVAGIAAGNGDADGLCVDAFTYVGVAPEADLVVVVLEKGADVGSAPSLVNAFDFIWDHLDRNGRPVVINASIGTNRGPHDGTSPVEDAIAADLSGSSGRAVVIAAGNESDMRQHAGLDLPAGGPSRRLSFVVPAGAASDLQLELWYRGPGPVEVSLVTPFSPVGTVAISPPGRTRLPIDDVTVHLATAIDARDRGYILAVLGRPEIKDAFLPAGTWHLDLTNTGADDLTVEAWLSPSDRKVLAMFTNYVDPQMTLTTPGTCEAAITVGAYAPTGPHHNATGGLAPFSSFGPTRFNDHKPDLVAPGVGIVSARPLEELGCWEGMFWNAYIGSDGTSMAAPHVTGVVALMLQTNPDLPHWQVKDLLMSTADDRGLPWEARMNRWGAGSVDAFAAVMATPPPGFEESLRAPGDDLARSARAPGAGAGAPAGAATRDRPSSREPRPAPRPRGAAPPQPRPRPALAAIVDRLASTPDGERWAALVSRHFSEVRRLVNHNRRVALRWHRLQGPALLARLAQLTAGAPPRETVLSTLDLGAFPGRLDAFLTALAKHGSPDLAGAVAQHRDALLAIDPAAVLRALGDDARAA